MKNIIKRLNGAAADAVAEAEAELARVRAALDQASADAQRLAEQWVSATSQLEAEKLDRQRREAERVAEREKKLIPGLEQAVAAARAERQREGLARWHKTIGGFAPKLIAALEHAARLQVEAIELRNQAVAELGESTVEHRIPIVAFRGICLPDLIAVWAHDLQQQFDPPSAKPAPAIATPPKPKLKATAPMAHNGPAQRPPARALRADPAPGEGQAQIVLLRNGIDLGDGVQSITGEKINLPVEVCRNLVASGCADFVASRAAVRAGGALADYQP